MSSMSDFLENEIADHIFGGNSYSPTDIYIALCTAAPSDSSTGSTITEPSGGSYARQQVSAGASWTVSGSQASNTSAITFPTATGQFTAPAHTIIQEFKQAKKEVAANPKVAPIWMTKIQAIPAGFLQVCETSIKMSKEKVQVWLEKYMLKSERTKKAKAKKIAEWLGNFNNHKTHGKPISFQDAKDRGLKVTALENDDKLQDLVLSVFHSVPLVCKLS